MSGELEFDFEDVGDSRRQDNERRIMALEIEAIAARRDLVSQIAATEKRVDRVEAIGSRIVWAIAGGALAMVVTVISASIYVGGRIEAISVLGRDVERLTTRIEQVERAALWREREPD